MHWCLTAIIVPTLALAKPPKPATFRISGVAVDLRSGAPIPFCRLEVSDATSSGENRQPRRPAAPETSADAQGRFSVTVDHAGAWALSGSARDYRRQAFEAHEPFFAAIVLTPDQPTAEVVLRMQRNAMLQGNVLDEAGEPVRDAQVSADRQGASERNASGGRAGARPAGSTQTDDRGHYDLGGLAPGSYLLHVQAQPWYAQSANHGASPGPALPLDPSLDVIYPTLWYPGVTDEAGAQPLQLRDGEDRVVDLQLTPLPAARVTIPRGEPSSSEGEPRNQRNTLLVRVSPSAPSLATLNSAASSNLQEFGGLQPGLYEIYSYGPDGNPDGEARQLRITAGESTQVDLATAERLTRVTLSSEGGNPDRVAGLTFTDPESGRLVVENENEMAGRRNGLQRRNETGSSRHVALAPGTWKVHLTSDRQDFLLAMEGHGLTVRGNTIIIGSEPASLLLHLGYGRGTVAGKALLGGKPVVGAMVLLVPASLGATDNLLHTVRNETSTDGSFTLHDVTPGKYILVVLAHGWDVRWQDTATLLPFLAHGAPVDVRGGAESKLSVQAIEP